MAWLGSRDTCWNFRPLYPWNICGMAVDRDFKFCTRVGHVITDQPYEHDQCQLFDDCSVPPQWAWSQSRELFLHFGVPVISLKRMKLYISNLICRYFPDCLPIPIGLLLSVSVLFYFGLFIFFLFLRFLVVSRPTVR